MLLGAGREKVDDTIDPAAGIVVQQKPGGAVKVGTSIFEMHYNDERRLPEAITLAESAIAIAASPPATRSALVLDHVT